MDLGEAIRLRRTELGMSQAALANAAGVDTRQIRRYEAGEQQPLFTAAVAIAAALRLPLADLAGLPAEPAARSAHRLLRVRHGIEFSARDDSNGELRVTGDDDAAVLLWAAAWLDEHRDWVVTGITFRYPAVPGHEGTTGTVVFELASPGTPSLEDMRPRLGPWAHGVPPMYSRPQTARRMSP
jgi:transcriptional regulator with XRE-family HTH domain